ncbi:hypothetical protein [Antarctobacter jejuensis]|uniref:hypothetical protein n=1 Tax=Antarctobacter jejuensis TaxID=1439938 RepID=UPI003FD2613E
MPRKKPSLPRRLWQEAPVLTLGFVAALLLILFFSGRLIMGAIYWGDPAHQDVPLGPWMTPRFVAMSWRVPPEVVEGTLQLNRETRGRRVTLDQLAAERGMPVSELIKDLEAAIAEHRRTHP